VQWEIGWSGYRAGALVGASAGWTRSLVPPAHGLGAGRNAGSNFGARRLFSSFILGLSPMKQGFPAFFRLDLCGFLGLGGSRGLVLVVAVKRPARTCGSGSGTEHAES
jgi:hypothetical protein